MSRFNLLVKNKELNQGIAEQLRTVLSTTEVVLLCDDSDSMGNAIAEEGIDPFAPKRSTRWLELKKLASLIIEFVTAINPNGLDIYFLNRPEVHGVNNVGGLQNIFNNPPNGSTPLIAALNRIFLDKFKHLNLNQLLIIVITDGEPTDGSRSDLFNTLRFITDNGKVHVSFAECTDNAEDMEYLDTWDGQIPNFDNTEDYREELVRVKNVQGQSFKFDYIDYVVKILLATFVRWFFQVDQVKVYDPRDNNYRVPQIQTQFQPKGQLNTYTTTTTTTQSNIPTGQPIIQSVIQPSQPVSQPVSQLTINTPPKNRCCVII